MARKDRDDLIKFVTETLCKDAHRQLDFHIGDFAARIWGYLENSYEANKIEYDNCIAKNSLTEKYEHFMVEWLDIANNQAKNYLLDCIDKEDLDW